MAQRPQQFGQYKLVELIGSGGMADVFRAVVEHDGFERPVAIKRMRPEVSDNPEWVEMFTNEARLTAQLSHPNIVQVFDFGEIDKQHYLAMELVEGPDLSALIGRVVNSGGFVSPPVAVYVGSAICDALAYAHSRRDDSGNPLGIVHRDVSPQNILVSREGQVKLTDFGIAKVRRHAEETTQGRIKGKFGYMAPEQIHGRPVDERTDVFAVGIVLHEVLTGQALFQTSSVGATIQRVISAPLEAPSRVNPRVPPELDEVVLHALQRDPDRRFQSASELLDDLVHVARDTTGTLLDVDMVRWLNELPGPSSSGARDTKAGTRVERVQPGRMHGLLASAVVSAPEPEPYLASQVRDAIKKPLRDAARVSPLDPTPKGDPTGPTRIDRSRAPEKEQKTLLAPRSLPQHSLPDPDAQKTAEFDEFMNLAVPVPSAERSDADADTGATPAGSPFAGSSGNELETRVALPHSDPFANFPDDPSPSLDGSSDDLELITPPGVGQPGAYTPRPEFQPPYDAGVGPVESTVANPSVMQQFLAREAAAAAAKKDEGFAAEATAVSLVDVRELVGEKRGISALSAAVKAESQETRSTEPYPKMGFEDEGDEPATGKFLVEMGEIETAPSFMAPEMRSHATHDLIQASASDEFETEPLDSLYAFSSDDAPTTDQTEAALLAVRAITAAERDPTEPSQPSARRGVAPVYQETAVGWLGHADEAGHSATASGESEAFYDEDAATEHSFAPPHMPPPHEFPPPVASPPTGVSDATIPQPTYDAAMENIFGEYQEEQVTQDVPRPLPAHPVSALDRPSGPGNAALTPVSTGPTAPDFLLASPPQQVDCSLLFDEETPFSESTMGTHGGVEPLLSKRRRFPWRWVVWVGLGVALLGGGIAVLLAVI
jgi:serine/threonine protein kinase